MQQQEQLPGVPRGMRASNRACKHVDVQTHRSAPAIEDKYIGEARYMAALQNSYSSAQHLSGLRSNSHSTMQWQLAVFA